MRQYAIYVLMYSSFHLTANVSTVSRDLFSPVATNRENGLRIYWLGLSLWEEDRPSQTYHLTWTAFFLWMGQYFFWLLIAL